MWAYLNLFHDEFISIVTKSQKLFSSRTLAKFCNTYLKYQNIMCKDTEVYNLRGKPGKVLQKKAKQDKKERHLPDTCL